MKHVGDKRYTDDDVELKRGDIYHLVEINEDQLITGYIKSNIVGNVFQYSSEYVVYNDFNKAMNFAALNRGKKLSLSYFKN